jgi:DNA (cytosine-5)-methyltransferase 1
MFNTFSVLDLFCGVGGLTHGFVKEGFNVIGGIDFDLSCKYAFEKNNQAPFYHRDLTIMHSQEINDLFPTKNRILVGCAPCQAFSQYNRLKDRNDKWKLLYSFGRIINDIKPEIVSMENVPQLANYDGGKVFKDFLSVLDRNGYFTTYAVVNAQEYGVPQRRKRLLLIASRYSKVSFIPKTHINDFVTVRQAIGHLPAIEDGISNTKDLLHRSRKLSIINKRRIKATPEGGGWKDWDEDLLLTCHKSEKGKSYRSVYGRMRWDDVSPTLTTQCTGLGNGRYGHPSQDRAISLREAALLQSFPKDYEFIDPARPFSTPNIERQIGNAVPVLLGQAIARTIKEHLTSDGS